MSARIHLLPSAVLLSLIMTAMAVAQTSGRSDRIGQPPQPSPPNAFAPAVPPSPLARSGLSRITLSAQLVLNGPDISRGMSWHVFEAEPDPAGKLRLVASAVGGNQSFELAPGRYLVHASYGRAGATKRVTVGSQAKRETFVLDAGGLEMDAAIAGGQAIPKSKLLFKIYLGEEKAGSEVVPPVGPNTVVRLNAGTYHVVSHYGNVNAVVRSDITVEAGKLTEATVEHRAAEVTMKLVRESGGEAIADTSWSVLSNSGDPIRESVGAFASMVLAEGDYTVVAKNRDHIYQRDFTVEAGKNQDVEVIADENAPVAAEGAD